MQIDSEIKNLKLATITPYYTAFEEKSAGLTAWSYNQISENINFKPIITSALLQTGE